MADKPVSAGAKFRSAMQLEQPLQVIGAINAYHARMAERRSSTNGWCVTGRRRSMK